MRKFKAWMRKLREEKSLIQITVLVVFSLYFSACSKQEFVRLQYSNDGSEIGFRYVPSKVDLIMVPDNTGSVSAGFQSINSQLAGFTSQLRQQYWDYHVMKSFIYNPNASQPMNQVLVNPEFNSTTMPDGSPNLNTDLVSSYYAVNDPNQFPLLTSADVYPASGSIDNTINNVYNQARATINAGTNFIRKDALLAVVIITNGVDGGLLMDSNNQFSSPDPNKVSQKAAMLKRLKTDYGMSDELIRFYSISAATYTQNGCYGGPSLNGSAYNQFLTMGYFQGMSRNFCDSNAVGVVLADIANDLEIKRQAYIYSHIVLDHEPVPESIAVFKNGSQLPNDSTNGWTYSPQVQTVYTVTGILDTNGQERPFFANRRTGYVITLHGSARMLGSDKPSVNYERR